MFFLDEDGAKHSLPLGWTDAAEPDPFVAAAAGRCPFRVADLLELAELITRLRAGALEADDGVRKILPALLSH